MTDPRIDAIRSNSVVGRGTCTTIDECYDACDLVAELDDAGITDPKEAVLWALAREGIALESALNTRWGLDDDPELTAWKNFNREFEKHAGFEEARAELTARKHSNREND